MAVGPGARPSMIKTNVSVRVRRRVSFRVSAKAMGLVPVRGNV